MSYTLVLQHKHDPEEKRLSKQDPFFQLGSGKETSQTMVETC